MTEIGDSLPLLGQYADEQTRESPCPDLQLLAQVAFGDEPSFTILYRRYSRPVYNYLLRLTSLVTAFALVFGLQFLAQRQVAARKRAFI